MMIHSLNATENAETKELVICGTSEVRRAHLSNFTKITTIALGYHLLYISLKAI